MEKEEKAETQIMLVWNSSQDGMCGKCDQDKNVYCLQFHTKEAEIIK